jgi:hypothetical protein
MLETSQRIARRLLNFMNVRSGNKRKERINEKNMRNIEKRNTE